MDSKTDGTEKRHITVEEARQLYEASWDNYVKSIMGDNPEEPTAKRNPYTAVNNGKYYAWEKGFEAGKKSGYSDCDAKWLPIINKIKEEAKKAERQEILKQVREFLVDWTTGMSAGKWAEKYGGTNHTSLLNALDQWVKKLEEKPEMTRREFLKLPIEERRKIISHQVAQMFENIPDEQKIKEMHDMMD
jgi:hypothetical protein